MFWVPAPFPCSLLFMSRMLWHPTLKWMWTLWSVIIGRWWGRCWRRRKLPQSILQISRRQVHAVNSVINCTVLHDAVWAWYHTLITLSPLFLANLCVFSSILLIFFVSSLNSSYPSLCSLLASCRYYGIAIVNSLGKKLKLPKGSVTITYQIHR